MMREWKMKRGEMLEDLIRLLQLRTSSTGKQKKEIDDQIIERHAMPWYEEGYVDGERKIKFIKKSKKLIQKISHLVNKPHELSQKWMSGISNIEEGYGPHAPNPPSILDEESMKEQFRIWHWTGGAQGHKGQQGYAMSKAIKDRLDKTRLDIETYQRKLQDNAEKKFLAEKNRKIN